jgi:hypothetical protein
VLGMHLATKQFVMLRNMRIDREAVRVPQSLADVRDLVVRHFSHISSDAPVMIWKQRSQF